MTVIDLTQRGGGSSTQDYVVLPTDVYKMKIIKAVVEENRFGEPDKKTGEKPKQLVLTWEMDELTDEQREAAEEAEEEWDKAQIWQRLNPYYGPVRDGGVSKFKAFVDAFREQGMLPDGDQLDIDAFVGITQRVSVEWYLKGQGENAGKPGNKVVAVMPLRKVKKTKDGPAPRIKEDEEIF